jgi:hypothetical protein
MKKLFFALVLCLLMQGCISTTATLKLTAQVLDGQKTSDQDGGETVFSHKKKTSVGVRPSAGTYTLEDHPTIFVSVYGSEKPFDFSTENIQVFVDNNPHRVLTIDELAAALISKQKKQVAEIESRYEAQSRNIAQGGYTANQGAVAGPGSGRSSGAEARSPVANQSYNVESVAESQSQIETKKKAEIDAVELTTKKSIAALDAVMLKKTTVPVNTWYRRWVALEKIPNPDQFHKIKVIVTVAGEKHEFLLNQVKVK